MSKSAEAILAQFGTTSAQITDDLAAFSQDARVLSSNRPRLINECPKQWIGVCKGTIQAQADTLESLMAMLKAKDIRQENTIVRYIDENRRIMIL